VNEGATASVTLAPDSGYQISGMSGTCPAGTLSGSSYTTGAINADCTVVANFDQGETTGMRLSTQGELLIFPYYAAHGDYQTLVTVTNTTPLVKGVKVAVREGLRGNEVLGWHSYIGPYEALEFLLSKDGAGNAAIYKLDLGGGDPCTVPEFPTEPVALVSWEFAEDSFNDLTRTGAGYIEAVEMGQWSPNSGLGYAAAAKDCSDLVSAWISSGGTGLWDDDPMFEALPWQGGGLSGSAAIESPDYFSYVTHMSYEATAIANFARYRQPAEFHTQPGSLTDAMRKGSLQFERAIDGITSVYTAETGLDALSALLTQSQLSESRPTSAAVGSPKSWLFSMPTKYHHESTGAMGPFSATWNPSTSSACEFFEVGEAPPSSVANVDLLNRENLSLCAATNWVVMPESESHPISPPEWLASAVARSPAEITAAKMVSTSATTPMLHRRIELEASYGGTQFVGLPVLSVPVYTNSVVDQPPVSGTTQGSLLRFLASLNVQLGAVNRPSIDKAEVNFSASNTGPLTTESYEVTCLGRGEDQNSSLVGTAPISPIALAGIRSTATYDCRLVAVAAEGTSAPQRFVLSPPQPSTPPGTPTISQSDVDDGEIYLYVTGDNGGLPILEYQASCTDGANTYTGSSGSSPVTVSGLTNGVSYQCQVRMRNSLGWSGYSSYSAGIVPEEATSGLPIWLLYQATQNQPPPVTCNDTNDTDGDRLLNCYETNTGSYVSATNTGTDPLNADTDDDGITDGDEVLGTTGGLNLPGMGANPLKKTILIEYDWLSDDTQEWFNTGTGQNEFGPHNHRPTAAVMSLVADVYSAAPVNNPDGSTGVQIIQDYGQGGAFTGGNEIADDDGNLAGYLGTDYYSKKSQNFAANRQGYFHYTIMAHKYGGGATESSGLAELFADDLIVSSNWWLEYDESVASTIVHELGHNLGLRHGGFEDTNNKPNYNSVMNYNYQFPGVDTDCSGCGTNCSSGNAFISGDGLIDYSTGSRNDLQEGFLTESFGVCSNVATDWNRNGSIDGSTVAADVNGDGAQTILEDSDDWANIYYFGPSDSAGASLTPNTVQCDNVPPGP